MMLKETIIYGEDGRGVIGYYGQNRSQPPCGGGGGNVISKSGDPKAGEVWHVKYPDKEELWTCDILEVTDKTVLICHVQGGQSYRAQRFEHGWVRFVERAK